MSEERLVVRTLAPHEWEVLRDVRLAALQADAAFFGSTYAGSVGLPESEWRSRCTESTWVAFLGTDPRAVGLVRLLPARKAGDPPEIISMWVASAARRRGVATALLSVAMDAARALDERVALWVVDTNGAALAAYRALGFEPSGATEVQPDGRVELHMVADITDRALVRRVGADDVDAFVGLREAMFVAMGVAASDDAWKASASSWIRAHLDDPRCAMLVVDHGGRVVASAMGQVREAMPSPGVPEGGDVLVSTVCVLPEARGAGHGRRAFDAVMAWARTTGIRRVELMATDAGRPMYERSGFAVTAWPCMRAAI